MIVRRLGTILFALVLSMIGATAEAAPISNTSAENYVTVFGPNRYFSPLVGSKTHTASFSVSPAPSAGEIIVTNGSGEDLSLESCNGLKALQKLACVVLNAARTVRMNLERPASAEISLNNVVVMRPQDLPRSINRLVIPVQLKASNSIKIKLSGSPLSSIKIEVRGLDHAAPVLTLQAPSEGQIINALSTSVSGSASERLSSAKAQLNNEPEIPLTLSSDGLSFSGNITTTQNGAKVLTVTGYDLAGNPGTVSRSIMFHLNRPPTASLVLASSGSGTAPFTVLFDASSSSDPDGDLLTYRFDFGDGTVTTSSTAKISHEFKDVGNYSVEVRVSDPSGDSQTASVHVTATAPELPADPAPFAPPLSQTTPQSFDETIRFLYDGPNAVQKDIAPDAIKADRVATISGKVLDQDGQPLSGVKVSSLGKDGLGYTISRAGGEFDIAVNSGGITTLKFERNGYTHAT
ncbi:MAG: PKD domain-containing protein, partial [Bdellovibrionaceae bacterium]|nr:PKD domain-containing protein [Pseudobdellovibrionaceae bacterium]